LSEPHLRNADLQLTSITRFSMKVDLSGLRALVTGSTKGIGRAIAQALTENGAEVAINGRKPADVEQAIAAIRKTLPSARLVPAPGDAATAEGVAAIIAAAGDVLPLIDVVDVEAGDFHCNAQWSEERLPGHHFSMLGSYLHSGYANRRPRQPCPFPLRA